MSETTPAVLSKDGMGRLKAEIEGLAAKLDVADALALGRARLLDLLATVLHRDAEIARLEARLAEVEGAIETLLGALPQCEVTPEFNEAYVRLRAVLRAPGGERAP